MRRVRDEDFDEINDYLGGTLSIQEADWPLHVDFDGHISDEEFALFESHEGNPLVSDEPQEEAA